MANIGQPVKIHEIEPLEEPVQMPHEEQPAEVEEPLYEPAYIEK